MERWLFLLPARLRSLGCDLRPLLSWQCGSAGQTALAAQGDGGRVLFDGRAGLGFLADGLQKNLMGELDRITRAFGCHASSMPSLALSATAIKFKLTHYRPPCYNTSSCIPPITTIIRTFGDRRPSSEFLK